MDTKYYVKAVTQCMECGGSGITEHPRWAEFWRAYGPIVEDINATLSPQDANDFWDRLTSDVFPDWKETPEQIPCIECEGDGVITKWIPLDH